MSRWLDALREPALAGIDLDGEARLRAHRQVLDAKPMIGAVFDEFRTLCRELEQRFLSGAGAAVEIGAGVAPMRERYADVLSTDVVFGGHLDCVLDAQRLPFAAGSVRVVYAQNVFHHLPDPERFLHELSRVLAPGGGALLLEPYYGAASRALYPRLFASEGFDMDAPEWTLSATGPMHGANQAQSYVVFVRDRARMQAAVPSLRIVHDQPLSNYLRYLASGGLNFRQIVPDAMAPLLRLLERALVPFRRTLALHHVVVLQKA